MAVARPPLPTADGPSDAVDAVIDLVRKSGGRATSARRLVLTVLFGAEQHRSAEELAREVQRLAPEIHLSTVYRHLEELEKLGVVVHSHLGHGPATYQLANGAHGQLVCEVCGSVTEAPPDLFSGLERAAKSRFGFKVHPFHFAVLGVCRDCAK